MDYSLLIDFIASTSIVLGTVGGAIFALFRYVKKLRDNDIAAIHNAIDTKFADTCKRLTEILNEIRHLTSQVSNLENQQHKTEINIARIEGKVDILDKKDS